MSFLPDSQRTRVPGVNRKLRSRSVWLHLDGGNTHRPYVAELLDVAGGDIQSAVGDLCRNLEVQWYVVAPGQLYDVHIWIDQLPLRFPMENRVPWIHRIRLRRLHGHFIIAV